LAHTRLETRGHHDDGRLPVQAAGLELPSHLATVDVRHQHVQDNPVVPFLLQLLKRLTAPSGSLDVESIRYEDHAFKAQDVFLIFDHE
jgi:hypothetical protein